LLPEAFRTSPAKLPPGAAAASVDELRPGDVFPKGFEGFELAYRWACQFAPGGQPDPIAITFPFQMACRLAEEGQLEAAAEAFARVAALCPQDFRPWEMRACCLGNLGRWEESLAAFEKAWQLGHECHECCYNRSLALCHLQRAAEALTALDRSLALEPNNPRAWFDRGMILGMAWGRSDQELEPFDGRHEQAVTAFDRVLALTPQHFEAWFYRACVLEKLCHQAQVRNRTAHLTGAPKLPFDDLIRQAAESFDRAIAIRPQDSQVKKAKADFYVGLFGEDRNAWPV
jgi:tetratricopeptide (TPR) repeat protein